MNITARGAKNRKDKTFKDTKQIEIYNDAHMKLAIIYLDPNITVQIGSFPVRVEIQPDAGNLITVYQKS